MFGASGSPIAALYVQQALAGVNMARLNTPKKREQQGKLSAPDLKKIDTRADRISESRVVSRFR
jgi:hypothetical protein